MNNNYDRWPKCRYCGNPSGVEMIGEGFACVRCCVMIDFHLRPKGIPDEWIELVMLTMVAEDALDESPR